PSPRAAGRVPRVVPHAWPGHGPALEKHRGSARGGVAEGGEAAPPGRGPWAGGGGRLAGAGEPWGAARRERGGAWGVGGCGRAAANWPRVNRCGAAFGVSHGRAKQTQLDPWSGPEGREPPERGGSVGRG